MNTNLSDIKDPNQALMIGIQLGFQGIVCHTSVYEQVKQFTNHYGNKMVVKAHHKQQNPLLLIFDKSVAIDDAHLQPIDLGHRGLK